MEMLLENNDYTVVENIFSSKVLKILEPYAKLLPTDKSSYDVWSDESTNNKTAPECFTCDVLSNDRLAVVDELYNNESLPCYQQKWLKDCDIAIQKLPVGGFIPKHTDYCILSLTVFLSEVAGGEFFWWDSDNVKHVVSTKYNTGIISCKENFQRGLPHEVNTVTSGIRFTLQLFVFDKKHKTTDVKGVVWEIEK